MSASLEMNNDQSLMAPSKTWTYLGLALALFAIPLLAFTFRQIFGSVPASFAVVRELMIFACALLLLWIIRSREKLSFASIDLVPIPLGRLTGWTLITLVGCIAALAVGLLCVQLFGLRFGSAPGTVSVALPLWTTCLIVLRAGIVEELFYRGYAITRLQALTGSKSIAIAVPLLVFAGFHYTQGAGGVLISLLLGGVLTAIYLWKRNLLIVVCAHFLVDFIPNVILPLVSGE